MKRIRVCFFLLGWLSFHLAQAQDVSIKLGPDVIALNQAFTITISVRNQRLVSYSMFPEIKGMVKRGTSTSSSTNFVNGRRSSSQSIIQNYVANAEGQHTLKPFTININGQDVSSKGKIIKVEPAIRQQRRRRNDPFGSDPFEDFVGQRNNQPVEFVDVEAEAFLALTSDKPSVYVGEGFTMTLAFYVSQKNQAELRFYELNKQLPEIIKKIKPSNCWEENFDIEEISGVPVTINGETYNQFKIYQAAFYPLNNEVITLPKVGLKLIKYKVAKNPSFFGRNKKEEIVPFYSKAKSIKVKDLPDHPLKETVSVGNYRLKEKISRKSLNTGESFNYNFSVLGEGNISAIKDMEVNSDDTFDLYPPNIRQKINRGNGKVRGQKSFSFYGIPNEPGKYDLSEYFSWTYFNPTSATYDTLQSQILLTVSGESKKNEYILSNDMGTFYDTIELQDNSFFSLAEKERARTIINIVIFAMLGAVAVLIFKK